MVNETYETKRWVVLLVIFIDDDEDYDDGKNGNDNVDDDVNSDDWCNSKYPFWCSLI